jgi:hypothetical protein
LFQALLPASVLEEAQRKEAVLEPALFQTSEVLVWAASAFAQIPGEPVLAKAPVKALLARAQAKIPMAE